MAPVPQIQPGHGIVFLFSPSPGLNDATPAQHLGLFNRYTNGNRTNRVLAVEFDVFRNEEFNDIDDNHVGVDLFSLTSVESRSAGYWEDESSFRKLKLNNGENYQAWVDYAGKILNVTMAPAGRKKPRKPLISVDLDLTGVFFNEMYVGFCAATGMLVQRHRILAWSFSTQNSFLSDALVTSGLPNFKRPSDGGGLQRWAVAMISASAVILIVLLGFAFLFIIRRRRNKKKIEAEENNFGEEPLESWEREYWPHRISYEEISAGTDNFSDRSLIGCGGSGKVYKGAIAGEQVAVKVFARNSEDDARQFAAEVSSLGRMKHRNLVVLRGWCRGTKREGGGMILVYEYMENGSLDRWIFSGCLNWERRLRILKDVAAGVAYLHEGWEERVLHRDIKASNVMLDAEMRGKLGDFGLAKAQARGSGPETSRVVGSVGYMAPEVVRSGKFSVATDVYGFGVLALEVVCGRCSVEEGQPALVDWVAELKERGELRRAVDLGSLGEENEKEILLVLEIGLRCTSEEKERRPSMGEVVRALEGPHEGKWGEGEEVGLLDRRLREGGSTGGTIVVATRQRHLTFEEVRNSVSCSMSISESDVTLEGR